MLTRKDIARYRVEWKHTGSMSVEELVISKDI